MIDLKQLILILQFASLRIPTKLVIKRVTKMGIFVLNKNIFVVRAQNETFE